MVNILFTVINMKLTVLRSFFSKYSILWHLFFEIIVKGFCNSQENDLLNMTAAEIYVVHIICGELDWF
jgi:hypothetical protein